MPKVIFPLAALLLAFSDNAGAQQPETSRWVYTHTIGQPTVSQPITYQFGVALGNTLSHYAGYEGYIYVTIYVVNSNPHTGTLDVFPTFHHFYKGAYESVMDALATQPVVLTERQIGDLEFLMADPSHVPLQPGEPEPHLEDRYLGPAWVGEGGVADVRGVQVWVSGSPVRRGRVLVVHDFFD